MYFKDIAGQEELKKKLIANITSNRVSHAQLFVGPAGSGKMAMAIAYARYLACAQPNPDDACGTCPSCVKYNKLSHPDLTFFYPIPSKRVGEKTYISKDFTTQWRKFMEESLPYPSLNRWYQHVEIENKQGIINAEDCNEIIRVLGYKSYESEYKVIIMWMIDRLYHSAAPKLLKILEEPPQKTLFLLISENQELILPTILSRSQMIKFPRLKDGDIVRGLTEKYNCDEAKAQEIAFLAHGNFREAIHMMESDETYESNTVLLREWLRACYTFDFKGIMTHVDLLAKLGREKQKAFLGQALEIFRQCTLLNYRAESLVRAHPQALDFIQKFSKVLIPQTAMLMGEEFTSAIYHIERNANPKILFTDLSLKSYRIMKAKR